ncbi:type II secretion system GspH family protein [Patescibacteria group bacterium]|nr:type II secretion system GspH family protein [Patescibacteria group bacterium]MCL5409937.1 type II secretion system GspH family protein [Patescibacteria group bacterium]
MPQITTFVINLSLTFCQRKSPAKLRHTSIGFTLIELLVVVSIMASIAVILIPQYTVFNNTQDLYNTSTQLQTALRTAQNNAASGVVCDPTYEGGFSADAKNKASSWDVVLSVTGGTPPSYSFQVVPECANTTNPPLPTPQPLAAYAFPTSINVLNVTCSNSVLTYDQPINDFKIQYSNITADAVIGCGSPTTYDWTKATIKLGQTHGAGYTACVIVDKGGGISATDCP